MTLQRALEFWGVLPLCIPFLAGGLRRPPSFSTRRGVDVTFIVSSVLADQLVAHPETDPSRRLLATPVAIVATVAISSALALLYAWLSRDGRAVAGRLLGVLLAVDAAGIGLVYLSAAAGLETRRFRGLLLLVIALAGFAAVRVTARIGRSGARAR